MNESGYHMGVLEVEVVMGTKYIGRNDTCETAAILLIIGPLCMREVGEGWGRGGERRGGEERDVESRREKGWGREGKEERRGEGRRGEDMGKTGERRRKGRVKVRSGHCVRRCLS